MKYVSAFFNQQLDHRKITHARGMIQRRPTLFVAFIDIRGRSQQRFDRYRVFCSYRTNQRFVAITTPVCLNFRSSAISLYRLYRILDSQSSINSISRSPALARRISPTTAPLFTSADRNSSNADSSAAYWTAVTASLKKAARLVPC